MSLVDHPAFGRVTEHLERLGAGAFVLYKTPCLERRLASRIRARRQHGLAEYAALLDSDAGERDRLVRALSIGVTSFFRNPTAWRRLAELLEERKPAGGLRGWSAGCASGEEAWSLAMVLSDRALTGSGDPTAFRVDATDLDLAGLALGRMGEYPGQVTAPLRLAGDLRHGRLVGDRFLVEPALRGRVHFRRDDLTESRVRGPYDVVTCRNVLIYFGDEGQSRALAALVRSLAPGGLLMLGRAELAARSVAEELEIVDSRERIYRRVE